MKHYQSEFEDVRSHTVEAKQSKRKRRFEWNAMLSSLVAIFASKAAEATEKRKIDAN